MIAMLVMLAYAQFRLWMFPPPDNPPQDPDQIAQQDADADPDGGEPAAGDPGSAGGTDGDDPPPATDDPPAGTEGAPAGTTIRREKTIRRLRRRSASRGIRSVRLILAVRIACC